MFEKGLETALVALRIEQIGDEHGHPRLTRAQRVGGQSVVERGRPICAEPRRELEQREEVPAPARRAPAFRHAVAHHGHPHALQAGQPDEAEGGGKARGVAQLGRLAESHGPGAIEKEVEVEILLVHEELQVEPVEPAVDVPVDVAEVVTRAVRTIVRELHAHALVWALGLAARRGPGARAGSGTPRTEGPGTGSRSWWSLFLVERLEVVLHLPVEVAWHLLARHVLFHLLAVLAEYAHVLEPRGHIAAPAHQVGVHPILAAGPRFALDAHVERIRAQPLGRIAFGTPALALAGQRAFAL